MTKTRGTNSRSPRPSIQCYAVGAKTEAELLLREPVSFISGNFHSGEGKAFSATLNECNTLKIDSHEHEESTHKSIWSLKKPTLRGRPIKKHALLSQWRARRRESGVELLYPKRETGAEVLAALGSKLKKHFHNEVQLITRARRRFFILGYLWKQEDTFKSISGQK